MSFVLASGAGKTLDWWEGAQSIAGTALPLGPREGTFISSLRIPTLMLDGVTSAHTSVLPRARPAHRVILLGDSIATGFVTSAPVQYGPVALLRQQYGYPTDRRTTTPSRWWLSSAAPLPLDGDVVLPERHAHVHDHRDRRR